MVNVYIQILQLKVDIEITQFQYLKTLSEKSLKTEIQDLENQIQNQLKDGINLIILNKLRIRYFMCINLLEFKNYKIFNDDTNNLIKKLEIYESEILKHKNDYVHTIKTLSKRENNIDLEDFFLYELVLTRVNYILCINYYNLHSNALHKKEDNMISLFYQNKKVENLIDFL